MKVPRRQYVIRHEYLDHTHHSCQSGAGQKMTGQGTSMFAKDGMLGKHFNGEEYDHVLER